MQALELVLVLMAATAALGVAAKRLNPIVVIVSTLLLQGLTLGALTRLLHIRDDDSDDIEEAHARSRLREAGVACIAQHRHAGALTSDLVRRVHSLFRFDGPAPAPELRRAVIYAQRRELLALFDQGRISDSVMRRLLRELDLQAALFG